MNHPTPQGLPVRDLTDDEKQFLHYNPNTSDLVEFVQAYAREAIAAQAATLESIHKIIECAGPEAADEIADLLGYPSVEWPSDQALTAPNLACKSAQARLATQWGYVRAASVEPVGRVARVEWCAHEQKWRHVIWADKKVPFGTPVFASAPPSPANVPGAVEPLTKDDIDKLAEVLEVTSLDEVEPETVYAFTRAIEARFAPQPQAVVASSPSPASVQNASLVEKLAKRTCEANADSARFTIALQTLRASLDPDDWMGAVTMHNYIDAVLAGGSPLQQHPAPSPAQATPVCGAQNAESYPQAPLSLTAAPQEWSPAYTRGPSRQSAPVAAVPAMVPLTEEQMVSAVRPLCNTDQVAERLVAVSIDEYRAIEAAIAKLNGLTVGDGTAKAQPFDIRND